MLNGYGNDEWEIKISREGWVDTLGRCEIDPGDGMFLLCTYSRLRAAIAGVPGWSGAGPNRSKAVLLGKLMEAGRRWVDPSSLVDEQTLMAMDAGAVREWEVDEVMESPDGDRWVVLSTTCGWKRVYVVITE